MKAALFWMMAVAGLAVMTLALAPIAIVANLSYRAVSSEDDIGYYFNAIAVGLDALGGSLIYGSKIHTISAITGARAYRGDRWHIYQEKMIDAWFGHSHCFKQAVDERMITIMEVNV